MSFMVRTLSRAVVSGLLDDAKSTPGPHLEITREPPAGPSSFRARGSAESRWNWNLGRAGSALRGMGVLCRYNSAAAVKAGERRREVTEGVGVCQLPSAKRGGPPNSEVKLSCRQVVRSCPRTLLSRWCPRQPTNNRLPRLTAAYSNGSPRRACLGRPRLVGQRADVFPAQGGRCRSLGGCHYVGTMLPANEQTLLAVMENEGFQPTHPLHQKRSIASELPRITIRI